MWAWLGSLLTGPIINGALKAYDAKLKAGNTSETIAANLATRELEVQKREIEVQGEYRRALIGRWYEPTNLFGYMMVIYYGKIIVWDKVLKLGTTDSITGQGAEWAGWIMLFFVGKRGFENVAAILKSKR
jgi:hypothetical protein